MAETRIYHGEINPSDIAEISLLISLRQLPGATDRTRPQNCYSDRGCINTPALAVKRH